MRAKFDFCYRVVKKLFGVVICIEVAGDILVGRTARYSEKKGQREKYRGQSSKTDPVKTERSQWGDLHTTSFKLSKNRPKSNVSGIAALEVTRSISFLSA